MNLRVPTPAILPALILCMLAASTPAAAYVGPGAGLSLLGALWAVVATIAAALFFLLMWPLRRLVRRFAGNRAKAMPADAVAAPADRSPLPAKH